MAQTEVQDLLRLLTTGRNKMPMLAAMQRVRTLQEHGLKSIDAIASATPTTLSAAIKDPKAAAALQRACKTIVSSAQGETTNGLRSLTPSKRGTGDVDDALADSARVVKRLQTGSSSLVGGAASSARSLFSLPTLPDTPAQAEAQLALPLPNLDEEAICATVLTCNRAPLLMAFAYVLLGFTMPAQPTSSRLSMAQAVVADNAKAKAGSLGITTATGNGTPHGNGWHEGQPKVTVMGREVSVLKRAHYDVDEDSTTEQVSKHVLEQEMPTKHESDIGSASQSQVEEGHNSMSSQPQHRGWTSSSSRTLKSSTFIAHVHSITASGNSIFPSTVLRNLPAACSGATHNISASRMRSMAGSSIIEAANDDGETGGGRFLLNVLREHNITDTLVVVSRWWGGIMLGTDRWRLMREVTVEALAGRMRLSAATDSYSGSGSMSAVAMDCFRQPLWAIDPDGDRESRGSTGGLWNDIGVPIHRPERARDYLLKSFSSAANSTKYAKSGPDHPQQASALQHGSKTTSTSKRQTYARLTALQETNLALLLGALELLFRSWTEEASTSAGAAVGREGIDPEHEISATQHDDAHSDAQPPLKVQALSARELDRRAWAWYIAVRPEVEGGVRGWGAKGNVRLAEVLNLRRTLGSARGVAQVVVKKET